MLLLSILHYYFDFVFNFGIFPNSCKIAEVVPIHKSGSKLEMGNYQPKINFDMFFKILEKLIHQQTPKILEKKVLLYQIMLDFKKYTHCSRFT